MSLEPHKHTKRIEINQSQTMTFWTHEVPKFPKRSAKIIDCNKKCKCQLAFKLQNLHVFEKCSNTLLRHWLCFLSPARRKRADLFLVCYRSVETSAADLQIVYRSSTDYLRIVCRMSAEYLQNVCRMSAEMICNLCRRSADEGGMNSKHNNRRTAPIKHLLFLS